MKYWLECFRKYAVFSGRSRRSEYWYFVLFCTIISLIISGIPLLVRTDGQMDTVTQMLRIVFFGFQLIILLPGLAVGVRRLHDIGKSGWWILVPPLLFLWAGIVAGLLAGNDDVIPHILFVLLQLVPRIMLVVFLVVYFFFMIRDSEKGPNRYGDNPKDDSDFAYRKRDKQSNPAMASRCGGQKSVVAADTKQGDGSCKFCTNCGTQASPDQMFCASCGTKLLAESETSVDTEAGKTFDISCPHCGETLLGSESIAGLTVECPYCSKTFVAPAAPAESSASQRHETPQPQSGSEASTMAYQQRKTGGRVLGNRRFRKTKTLSSLLDQEPQKSRGTGFIVVMVLLVVVCAGYSLYRMGMLKKFTSEWSNAASDSWVYNDDSGVRNVEDSGHKGVQLWKDGPYWADTNIGAEKSWESGYYFWWGGTIGYKREGNAWVASNGSSSDFKFEKEIVLTFGKDLAALYREGWTGEDGILLPEHDAAHVHWGGKWRMPTKQELYDLIHKCNCTWEKMNGVNGYVVRGKGDYASASIFLPAAGWSAGTSVNRFLPDAGTSLYDADSVGGYWPSVPRPDSNDAWYLNFDSRGFFTSSSSRDFGRSVRPIQGFTK